MRGCSIRAVERVTGVYRNTVMRVLVAAGEHCEAVMEREIHDVLTNSVQCDELWSFVQKKQRRLQPSTVTCNATPCTSASQCSGGLCVRTCVGGLNSGEPCFRDGNCLDGVCGSGFCRDRCGNCAP